MVNRLRSFALIALSISLPAGAGEPAYAVVEANIQFEALQEIKRQLFDGQDAPYGVDGTGEDRRYTFSKKADFLKFVAEEYLSWKRPGVELTRDAQGQPRLTRVRDPSKAYEDRESFDRVKERIVQLNAAMGSLEVGFVRTDMERVLAVQDPDRPRAGLLDIFQVPSIVETATRENVPVGLFLRDLKASGHWFLLLRAQLDPPMLQEEILYVWADAPNLRPYSLVGPAYAALW